jgi:transposase
METTALALDSAKNAFQLHGVDAQGHGTLRKAERRQHLLATFAKMPPCLIGIEACASAHHWARKLQELGHGVRG